MDWLKIGYGALPFVVSIIMSVAFGILAFNRYISPGIVEALEEATKTAQTLASLGGIKKEGWKTAVNIEKAVAQELIREKLPELEALKVMLNPSTWEMIEEAIEDNPAAIIQLYEKYGHHLGGASQKQEEYNF